MRILLDIYRFLRSYIVISVQGGFPERFLNLCGKGKIYLWDVEYSSGCVTAKIGCRDFPRLKAIRAKSGVKIKIEEKKGLIFFMRAQKKHRVIFAGTAAAVILMCIMNQFVWTIDVSGNSTLSKADVLSAAQALGVSYGTFVPALDEGGKARELVNLFDGKILWAAVNIRGSKALLEIREKPPEAEKSTDSNTPCNIVADFDGVILSNETYCGTACTAVGNAVKSGDILISGISENADGSVNLHVADGKLTARHKRDLSLTFPARPSLEGITVNHRCTTLRAFSLNIPLSLKALSNTDAVYEYSRLLTVDNTVLPFGVIKQADITSGAADGPLPALIFALDEFTKNEQLEFKNTLVTGADYKIASDKSSIYISADYDCIDFIGKKSNILQEN